MPRRTKKFVPFVDAQFATNKLNWDSNVRKLKYFGAELTNQLNVAGIDTLRDVIEYVDEKTNDATVNDLALVLMQLTRSPHINECKGTEDNPYLPRAFNRMGFNALADLVHFAAQTNNVFDDDVNEKLEGFVQDAENNDIRRELVQSYNENNGANIGPNANAQAMRRCPCRRTPDTCNADDDCQWIARGGQNNTPGCVANFIAEANNLDDVGNRLVAYDSFRNTQEDMEHLREKGWDLHGVVAPHPNNEYRIRIPLLLRRSTRNRRPTRNT